MQPNPQWMKPWECLSPADSARVISALRQDHLVWDALANGLLEQAAARQDAADAASWSPTRLALLAAGISGGPHGVAVTLPEGILPVALQAYELLLNGGQFPTGASELESAALAALALHERFRLTGSWDTLLREPCHSAAISGAPVQRRWRALLAILHGLVSNPGTLLQSLAALPDPIAADWCCHCVLTTPLDEAEQAGILIDLLRNLPLERQGSWVQRLLALGRPTLAQAVAAALAACLPADLPTAAPEQLPILAQTLRQRAALQWMAGDTAGARESLSAAGDALLMSYAAVAVQATALESGAPQWDDIPLQAMVAQAAREPRVAQDLLLGLGRQIQPGLETLLPAADPVGLSILYRARAIFERNPETARELGRQAAAVLRQECAAKSMPYAAAFFTWDPTEALDHLQMLGLAAEACQLVDATLVCRPADLPLLRKSIALQRSAGALPAALETARLALLLDPAAAEPRRVVAGLCEELSLWEDALAAWEDARRLSASPEGNDRLGVARCAFHCEQYPRALEICSALLDENPDLGPAHALCGEIALREERGDDARHHLSRATLLSPEEPRPWLLLAGLYAAAGQSQRQRETLHAAVMAVPESGDLHLALAQACLDLEMPSEALPHLQQATRLLPACADAAWLLGRTLNQLGHARQARRVLEAARARWPQHPLVAIADAETLMDAGEMDAAIQPLEVAVQSEGALPEWYLLYARALLADAPERMVDAAVLADPTRLERAELALRVVLAARPGDFDAGALLAETLLALGQPGRALELYSALVEDPHAALPEWRWRVQAGFGRSALAAGQVETAVAALSEAVQAQPDDMRLSQHLTAAYRQASLPEDAAVVARQTMQIAPADLGNLTWYIETMQALGRESETIEALQSVTHLDPDRADCWNLLAQVQAGQGHAAAAQSALQSLTRIENLSAAEYSQAAGTYTRLNDLPAALACLERAACASDPAPAGLLFETSAIHHRLGNTPAALDAARAALDQAATVPALHVFLADLLAGDHQYQPALASLEHALRLLELEREFVQPAAQEVISQGSLPAEWWESLFSRAAIYTRFALLLRAGGSLAAALHHAENALALAPRDLSLRYLAADLACNLLEPVRAINLARLDDLDPAGNQDTTPWTSALAALRVEMALDAGEDSEAGRLAQMYLEDAPEETRYLAIQSRLLLRVGNTAAAQNQFAAAISALKPVEPAILRAVEYGALFEAGGRLALAETALELEHWGEALRAMEACTAEHAQEPRAHLRYARALVLCAERQHACEALRCTTHAPGADVLNGTSCERFERAIQAAARLAGAPEISVWQARGRAAFQPGLQNAPALARLPNPGEHAPALLAVLRLSQNSENALRIAPHYPRTAALLAELALCSLGLDNRAGVEAARKAAELGPERPLYHSAHALLAEAAGENLEALHAIQTALTLWPDEPVWQSWAARLCQAEGDPRGAIAHLEQCLALEPAALDTALDLGRLYIHAGQSAAAVNVLERACLLAPVSLDACLLLAQARRASGDLDAALETTETAAKLAPDQPAPRLLSGEVALQMGKNGLALQHARAALACAPTDPAALLFLSRVLAQTGSPADGLAVLEKALPEVGQSQPVLLERANLIRRLYGPQVALSAYVELGQCFPQDARVLSLLAQTLADCGDFKSAERTAYAAYQLNPELPQLNLLLGQLQRSAGQLDQSIHFFSEAIRQSPSEIEPYLDLGEVFLSRREHLQALHTYQQAIKIAPRDFRPFCQAAAVLRDSKDYVGAEAMLRRAAELAPGDLNIRRQLGAVIALNLVHNSQEANSAL